MTTPAEQLAGLTLEDGWTVVRLIPKEPGSTGGNFSSGYVVRSKDGKEAFLKALDYSRALRSPDPALALQKLTAAFNFERDLLFQCKSKGLSRIVHAIAEGKLDLLGQPVQYLIFELAKGDARTKFSAMASFDLAWVLRTLHQIAAGLQQLHVEQIAHQDIKPSNVLIFEEDKSKLADLGRASLKGVLSQPPHEAFGIAGDPAYAPPELLYGHVLPDWNKRRFGCDSYLLGSMAAFFFAQVPMTGIIKMELNPDHQWKQWKGTYPDVLPYVHAAFEKALQKLTPQIPAPVQGEINTAVKHLCNPDPTFRGHPKDIAMGNQFSLERFVSMFDLLASKAEMGRLN
jgi:eukaryotic-like serine/threonine-protein kinase